MNRTRAENVTEWSLVLSVGLEQLPTGGQEGGPRDGEQEIQYNRLYVQGQDAKYTREAGGPVRRLK